MEIPECFYRISVKALILNETRDKFLICQEEDGKWELPGGGLDFGTTPQEDLPREIKEEMGLEVQRVADYPSYFITEKMIGRDAYRANVIYEATVADLNFTPSNECVAIRFVDKTDVTDLDAYPNVVELAHSFKSSRHQA